MLDFDFSDKLPLTIWSFWTTVPNLSISTAKHLEKSNGHMLPSFSNNKTQTMELQAVRNMKIWKIISKKGLTLVRIGSAGL